MLYIKELGDYDTAVVMDTDDRVEEITPVKYLLEYAKLIKIHGVNVEKGTVTPFDIREYIERCIARDKLMLGVESKYSAYNGVLYLEHVNLGTCRKYPVIDGTYYLGFGNIDEPVFESKFPFEVVLPKSCEMIQYQAFKGTKLAKINLSYVRRVGDKAFQECKKLKRIALNDIFEEDEDPINLGDYCFESSGVQDVELGEITFIPSNCFSNCRELKSVKARNVRRLDYNAFYNCDSLTSVEFGEALETIDGRGFFNCNSLKSIHLETVQSVGIEAFARCYSLNFVDLRSLDVQSSGGSSFLDTPLKRAVLPRSSKDLPKEFIYRHLAISDRDTVIKFI